MLPVIAFIFTVPAFTQQMDGMDMPGMSMPQPAKADAAPMGGMQMTAHTLIEAERNHGSSGTSIEPASASAPMWMGMRGHWMWMLHGTAFVTDVQQSSQRGGDKLFSGPESAPTFLLGNFMLSGDIDLGDQRWDIRR